MAKLNAEIGKSISEFHSATKDFELKMRINQMMLRGKGYEFDGYRDYSPDDDADIIDWKASVRAGPGRLLAKKYTVEKDLKVMFLVDTGNHMISGSAEKLKGEYVAEVVAALADLIVSTGNYVGYALFSDKIHKFVNPVKGRKQFNSFTDDLTNSEYYKGVTDFDKSLEYVARHFGENINSLIIVSDFLSVGEGTRKRLDFIARRFETMAIIVRDKLDSTLPEIDGEFVIENPATGEQMVVNPKVAKSQYEKFAAEREKEIDEMLRMSRIDALKLRTDELFVPLLSMFLKKRKKSTVG